LSDHAIGSTSTQHDVSPDSYDKYGDCLRTGSAFHSYFRSQPNEALERVLAAAAKAAANMPNLRSLTITMDICPCLRIDEQPEKFELAYGTRGSEKLETGARAVTLDWIAPRE
jgi:hypothetical protein